MSRPSRVRANAGQRARDGEEHHSGEHGRQPDCLTTTVERAGKLLGISRGCAYQAARSGELPGVLRIGHRYVVSVAALHKALQIDDGHDDSNVL